MSLRLGETVSEPPDGLVLSALGIDVERIPVDERMRTDKPNVYAVGDVAHAHNATAGRRLVVEHWGEALNMGEVAGRTIAGRGRDLGRRARLLVDDRRAHAQVRRLGRRLRRGAPDRPRRRRVDGPLRARGRARRRAHARTRRGLRGRAASGSRAGREGLRRRPRPRRAGADRRVHRRARRADRRVPLRLRGPARPRPLHRRHRRSAPAPPPAT